MATKNKNQARKVRAQRQRKTLVGSATTPRLNVYRSNTNIYAQLIDDNTGKTIAASSTLMLGLKSLTKETAAQVGTDIAKKAKAAKITTVVFDRGGFKYHGRIAALADAARAEGLKF